MMWFALRSYSVLLTIMLWIAQVNSAETSCPTGEIKCPTPEQSDDYNAYAQQGYDSYNYNTDADTASNDGYGGYAYGYDGGNTSASASDGTCISVTSLCDDVVDCVDGWDECDCNGSVTCNRSVNNWGLKCVPLSNICDDIMHCAEGDDEVCDWHLCRHNGKKIKKSSLCDGIDDCRDATSSDECGCPNTAFCQDKRCIQQSQLCDGIKDCSDGSDECHCDDTNTALMFHCVKTKTCVDKKLICDGKIDCGSYAIKTNDRTFYVLDCTDEQILGCNRSFACDDATRQLRGDVITRNVKTCVTESQRCDGKADCADGSDECACADSLPCPPRHGDVTRNEGRFFDDDVMPGARILDRSALEIFGIDKPPTKCLLRHNLCDGVSHCDGDSDERISGFGFKCHLNASKTSGDCVIPQIMVNDDVIDCVDSSDVCMRDGKWRCFRCLDGSITISTHQVCDDIIDCPDLSDECLCDETNRLPICDVICDPRDVTTNCSRGTITCSDTLWVPFSRVCDGHVDCVNHSQDATYQHVDEDYCVKGHRVDDHVISCPTGSGIDVLRPKVANKCDLRRDSCIRRRPECSDLFDECEVMCDVRAQYCRHLAKDWSWRGEMRFHCSSGLKEGMTSEGVGLMGGAVCDGREDCNLGEDEAFCPHRFNCDAGDDIMSIDVRQVCDGTLNCLDRSDELNCSEYFYCEGGKPLFVPRSSMHDGKVDCDDISDECPKEAMATIFASAREMIALPFFRVMVWIMAFLALIGNSSVATRQLWLLWQASQNRNANSVATSNHLLILNLAVADLLTGIYLLTVAVHSVKFSGIYCQMDKTWRTSDTCRNLGYLNSVATETSVVILTIMTSVRLHSVYLPFKRVTFKRTALCCAIGWAFSITAMLPPRLHVFSDYFSGSVWYFSPFYSSDIVTKQSLVQTIERFHVLANDSVLPPSDWSWGSIERFLARYFPPSERFSRVGYYGSHSVCIPNMLPRPTDPAVGFSASVTVFNLAAMVYVIIAYAMIYKKATKANKLMAGQERGGRQSKARAIAMQRRIFRLVASNLACWLPVTVLALVKLAGVSMSQQVYAAAAILLLPVTSALDPLLYSDLPQLCGRTSGASPALSKSTTATNT